MGEEAREDDDTAKSITSHQRLFTSHHDGDLHISVAHLKSLGTVPSTLYLQ